MPRVDERIKVVKLVRSFPVEDLIDHPENPHVSDDEAIQESIAANGFASVVTVQQSTGLIVAGHGRKRAALAEGMTHVPVVFIDVDDVTARRILLADNRASELGHDDDEKLAALLSGMDEDDLLGTLYAQVDVDVILAAQEPPPAADSQPRSQLQAGAEAAPEVSSLVLAFDQDDYDSVVADLTRMRGQWGVDSLALVVRQLAREAVEALDG